MISAEELVAARARLQDDLKAGLNCIKDLWQYSVKDWITSLCVVGANQDGDTEVLAGSHSGRVYSLDKDGQLHWECIVGDKVWVTAVAVRPIEADLDAYVAASTRDGKIYLLSQGGEAVYPPGHGSQDPLYWYDTGQTILQMWTDPTRPFTLVFSSDDQTVYHFDVARNCLDWKFLVPGGIQALYVHDVDDDGRAEVLVGSKDGSLLLLSPTGQLIASCVMEQTVYALYAADINNDKQIEILAGTRTKKLFVLDLNLQEKWTQRLSSRPLAITVLDVNSDGQPEILVSCDDQTLSIFDTAGRQVWRHQVNKRFHCLCLSDIDRDRHVEILAGTDDSNVQALRIQLQKDLNKRISRSYASLKYPDITTLTELTNEQLNLLTSVVGLSYGSIDKSLNLEAVKQRLAADEVIEGLLLLLKLERQRFQLQWEKTQMGFRRALCLADLGGDKKREVVVGSRAGGLAVFNSSGRLLWSEKPLEDSQIFDAQSGFLSAGHGEDLAFMSSNGVLSLIGPEKPRMARALDIPEPLTCFYMLAPGNPTTPDLLVGARSGLAYLYTNDLTKPARHFEMSSVVQRVYVSEPDESGKYRNPELLIVTDENTLFAYTRGGKRLWSYPTRSRIMALCVRDLDGDGRLEVLIGSEDRNIYVLDDNGNLRWRYVLYHMVLALEAADVNGDGKQEILAGCGDGILYVFTSVGDLIWRYNSRDPIQALRAADIDQDGNFEIVMVEESHLEVLQIIPQKEVDDLKAFCWQKLLNTSDPLAVLFSLVKDNDPHLRAAALTRLVMQNPLPLETFDLLGAALEDAFVDVRKALPEAVMHAYSANPAVARSYLNILYADKSRDVRVELIDHLEILVRQDWSVITYYLERALRSNQRNTRRAAIRKISHLVGGFPEEIRDAQHTLGETLFKYLLIGAQDPVSIWVRQEAGRVLAAFLELFKGDFLHYLLRLFANHVSEDAIQQLAYNLVSPEIQQVVVGLQEIVFGRSRPEIAAALQKALYALEALKGPFYAYSTELWLIFGELHRAFRLSTIEKLASYEFALKPEQFQTTLTPYPHSQLFLRVAANLPSITEPLKAFQRRSDPNDRLNSLMESISALDIFTRLVDREYGVSPLPKDPPPFQPEFTALKALLTGWQEMFNVQRNELRGHPELECDLMRRVHFEEIVGVWLEIKNHGRAPARQVKVTLLSDPSFTTAQPQVYEIETIPASQDDGAEFLIKPLSEAVRLMFEVAYLDAEHEQHTFPYQERLDFIERPQKFTPIENLYSTGTPLHNSQMCFGREAPLNYLHDNLTLTNAQTVLVLYGQRRSGKTTLLNQLAKTEMLDPHVAVMVDMQNLAFDYEDGKFFIGKFFFKISHWISKTMRKKGLPVVEPAHRDFVDPAGYPDPLLAFELFLDEVEIALQDRHLVLLLDEFEELENLVRRGYLQPEIFKYLRSLIQARPYIHFLLSGTQQISQLVHDYWSVFFNIALHYQLPNSISAEGAVDLITRPLAGSLEYEPQVVNKIRLLTADQPYMIHLVCRALVDHCNKMEKNYATINDVNLVLDDVLMSGTIHFDWLWDRFGKTEQLLLQVIADGAGEEGRLLDLEDIVRIYQDLEYTYQLEQIRVSLKVLWAEDVITARGKGQETNPGESTRYMIVNGLLRQWLKREKPLERFQLAPDESSSSLIPRPRGRGEAAPAAPLVEESLFLSEEQQNGARGLSEASFKTLFPEM